MAGVGPATEPLSGSPTLTPPTPTPPANATLAWSPHLPVAPLPARLYKRAELLECNPGESSCRLCARSIAVAAARSFACLPNFPLHHYGEEEEVDGEGMDERQFRRERSEAKKKRNLII
jgi:hypothetical protein